MAAAEGSRGFFAADLSHIHHSGFTEFAQSVAPELIGILRGAGVADGLVVDLGCGSGVWARALLDAGYRVLGVDVAPAMLEIARRVAPEAEFALGSLHDFPLPRCSAVTALGEPLGYIVDAEPNLHLLFRRVYDALASPGLFAFDLIVREDPPMRYTVRREGTDWEVTVDVDEDRDARIVTRQIRTTRRASGETSEGVEVHRVRTYDRAEIRDALESVGFEPDISDSYGNFRLAPRRIACIARK